MLCFIGFLLIALCLAFPSTLFTSFDQSVLQALSLSPSSSWASSINGLRSLFDFWPSVLWLVIVGGAIAYHVGFEACIEFGILDLGVLFFSRFEKIVFLRHRPETALPSASFNGFSFPSAHALRATGLVFCALCIEWPHINRLQKQIATILGSCIFIFIGLAELLLSANYPSDVMAAILLGAAWALSISALWAMRSQHLADQ